MSSPFQAVEPLLTRGFRDGKTAWIDVYPPRGPRMRITHEVLGGLGDRMLTRAQHREMMQAEAVERLVRKQERRIAARRSAARRRNLMYLTPGRVARTNYFGPEVLAGLEKPLTYRARERLPAGAFALPGRRFPIHDCRHARNALSRASMSYHRGNLSRHEHETVVRKARAAMRRLCP